MIVYSGSHYKRDVFPWNFAKNNEEFTKAVRELRTIGGTTNTKLALEAAYELMQSRNTSIPNLILVVTDGRSDIDPAAAAKRLQDIPQTWMFAAATGDPERVDRFDFIQTTTLGEKTIKMLFEKPVDFIGILGGNELFFSSNK
jgi:hypothetical protein